MTELFDQRKARSETRILIADDDMFMRSVIKKTLKGMGETIEDERGDNVLKLYQEHLPDVVLLDIHMPGKQGFDLLKELLAFDPTAYIVMISSDATRENVMRSINEGAKGFVGKPFNPTVLKKYVQFCETVQNGEAASEAQLAPSMIMPQTEAGTAAA
jgi:DNA-binding NarL/FixJ family response regulator